MPGEDGDSAGGRDSATGDLNGGSQGSSSSGSGGLQGPSGDYSLDTLPDGVLSGSPGGSGQAGGAMTSAERAAILDEQLRRGYETFDGFILSERERAQNESNAAGSAQAGADAGGGGGGSQGQPQTLEEAGQQPRGAVIAAQPATGASPPPPDQDFPVPEDIPSGRDDDVLARQLREAAMSEPDPELREQLWDEYRRYTGISQGDEQ